MQILPAEQIRLWDAYTVTHEPIASIDLMERAAMTCTHWLLQNGFEKKSFSIFCAKGNNGADGLAIARQLIERGHRVYVHILEFGNMGTEEFQINLAKLHAITKNILFIQSEEHFPILSPEEIIIDALFGSGLNRPLEGNTAKLVNWLNNTVNKIISIDIPSGLFADKSSINCISVKADHTLSFQCYKRAFLVAENEERTGLLHILDIGLMESFLNTVAITWEFIDPVMIRSIYRPRNRFSHKGNFGHALLVCGSYGKMGAAVLAAKACLRTGSGLLTCHVPACGYVILQSTVPEAMVMTDEDAEHIHALPSDLTIYKTIGIGPGLSTHPDITPVIERILNDYPTPVVMDADALNILSQHPQLLSRLTPSSILTPHPKEFDRLFGNHDNEFDRMNTAQKVARELQVIIILKGHYTFIAMPGGKGFFNTTGNAGMAKGGSGDVLTGMLTSLLAQGYTAAHAALLGVYLHGLAGDIAVKEQSLESLLPGDLVENIGKAFRVISQ